MALGSQIKKYRKAAGLTYAGLEDLSGVGTGSINAVEKRGSETSKHALALAKAMGLTLDQLLDEGTDYAEHVREHVAQQLKGTGPAPSNVVMAKVPDPWPVSYWPFAVPRDLVKSTLSREDLDRVSAYMLGLVQARQQELAQNSAAASNGRP
jgi:transcriptional regulator with XRE-family HTH domain